MASTAAPADFFTFVALLGLRSGRMDAIAQEALWAADPMCSREAREAAFGAASVAYKVSVDALYRWAGYIVEADA